jgi:16S rRNA (cytidine1402-2'-O)-methyltransferase
LLLCFFLNIAPLLQQAAAAAAGAQQYPAGALYVVATPIGNLADMTLRAVHVLTLVDAVACEDTRVTGGLLRHLAIDKPLVALHEHNESRAAATVIERLAQGQRIAYVSDAGTPAISDPGAALVAAVRAAGHRTVPVPGASSVVAALSVAGDAAADGFRFAGFLSSKAGERRAALDALGPGTAVLFEAPHRIVSLAQALADQLPGRTITLCRELTKQFEAVHRLAAEELPAWLAGDPNRVRGEFVVVVHAVEAAAQATTDLPPDAERALTLLLESGLPLKQAVSLAAALSGGSRNLLYARALELRPPA